MRKPVIALCVVAVLSGCGASGAGDASRHPSRQAGHSSGARAGRALTLPRVGSFTATCPDAGTYRVTFRADPETATDDVRVEVAGSHRKRASVDPGNSLAVTTPPKATTNWRITQATEPHTIRALVRMGLGPREEGGPGSCEFVRVKVRLTTRSNSAGG
jgi:hypothetical protein